MFFSHGLVFGSGVDCGDDRGGFSILFGCVRRFVVALVSGVCGLVVLMLFFSQNS